MITDQQKQAVKLFYQGMKVHEVAQAIGVHRTTLWRWYHRPEMIRYTERYFEQENKRLFSRCIRKLNAELDSKNPNKSYQAALKIIDLCHNSWLQPNEYPSGGAYSR